MKRGAEAASSAPPPPPPLEQGQLSKPWFLSGGTEYPTNFEGTPKLFPDEDDGDRIVEQLMYVPEDYQGKKSLHTSINPSNYW